MQVLHFGKPQGGRSDHNRDPCITNHGTKPVFTTVDSIAIAFPLEDQYEGSDICMTNRRHTHIFCGGNISYVMALRMGGEAPHFGMVLTEGSLSCYSVRRDISKGSNDRGCFELHPSPMELKGGESRVIRWVIFPHKGKADFKEQLGKYCRFMDVQAGRYVLFCGERNRITVRTGFKVSRVMINGVEAACSDGEFFLEYTAETIGEQIFYVEADGVRTWCRTYVHTSLDQLVKNRCRFIVRNQQYHGTVEALQGAYLTYDNEEKHMVYQPENDYNGGRERVGMGLMIAKYLREDREHELEDSLRKYTEYVLRELVDADSGQVFNDIRRDDSYKRLYNLPWYAAFFLELYYLYGQKDYRRGVLPLIFPDGSASCAYLYPYTVNGIRAGYYDPYANDQDWGLYIYLTGDCSFL